MKNLFPMILKCKHFNSCFAIVAAKLKEPNTDFQNVADFVDSNDPRDIKFSIPKIRYLFVREYWSNLAVSKAIGLDCIDCHILEQLSGIVFQLKLKMQRQ